MRWQVNHKRVYRLYREEGLAMRRKAKKRLRSEARTAVDLPTQANQVWTMDFTHDSMAQGRKFRTLNLMDQGNLHRTRTSRASTGNSETNV
jgi:putative transposase